jgi:hypothetical protein
MRGLNNFYRYEDELVAVYRRFGREPFAYREISDIVSKRTMSQLMARGFLVCHESATKSPKGRVKVNRWRLQPGVVEKCLEVPGCPAAL